MRIPKLSRPVMGWALYDFANSAYSTSIMSVIFSVYLVNGLVPPEGLTVFGMTIPGESVWGYLLSMVMTVVIVISPSLGAVADQKGLKNIFLKYSTWIGGGATILLFFATPDRLWLTIFIFIVATIAYELSVVFYNAFLNDVASQMQRGTISGIGFAAGYIGGGLCLALNMLLISNPNSLAWSGDKNFLVRLSFVMVGLWWLGFSIPTFKWVKDQFAFQVSDEIKVSTWSVSKNALRQLKTTFLWVIKKRNIGRFLLAYIIYNDGIQTIVLMASIFGAKALHMSTGELGLCYLMIQFVAFVGASVMGPWADVWSHKKVILVTLIFYTLAAGWSYFMTSRNEFWVLGFVIGLILGGSQAASRSLYSNLIPREKSGELFAFYSVVGKAAALIGPFVFAVVSQSFGLRMGAASLMIFFIVGGALLTRVKEPAT